MHRHVAPPGGALGLQHLNLRHVPGGGVVVRVGAAHHHAVIVLVQGLDHVALALVHVHSPGVRLVVRLRRVHGPQQGAGVGVDNARRPAAVGPQVHHGRRPLRVGPEPAGGTFAQVAPGHELVQELLRSSAEQFQLGDPERQFGGRGAEMRTQHVGIGGIEDGGFHRNVEDRLGMIHEVGVQRIITSHKGGNGILACPARTADLLEQRRPGSRPAGHQHRVQPRNIDAELQSRRAGDAQELAGAQGFFEGPALFRQVARAVGRDPLRQAGIHFVEEPLRDGRNRLGAPPRLDEGDGPHP